MKPTPSIIPATAEHIPLIVANMREADIEEMALLGLNAVDAVRYSLKTSRFACTGFVGNEAVCIFGVSPSGHFTPLVGLPWMFGTDALETYAAIFLKRCKPQVKRMLDIFSYLENHVSVSNVEAIEWLRWLGFDFDAPEAYGPLGSQFMKFHRGR
jgi:hypothetical protein